MEAKQFCKLMIGTAGLCIFGAGLVNLIVDPYDRFDLVRIEGFNQRKPGSERQIPLAKSYQAERAAMKTVLLGNSRVAVGIDPESAAWPEALRPVYNLGMPAIGMRSTYLFLRHALADHAPTTIMLGLDFIDFLTPADALAAPSEEFPPVALRLQGMEPGDPVGQHYLARISDLAAATLSLDALSASFTTVARQRAPAVFELTQAGFLPTGWYARLEGSGAVFEGEERLAAKEWGARSWRMQSDPKANSGAMFYLRKFIELARSRNAQLYIFIHPYHARFLDIFERAGLLPDIAEWKRGVAALVEGTRTATFAPVIWDFSGYNSWTTEPVPAPTDRRTLMRWHWELTHYKASLGDLLLGRIFGPSLPLAGMTEVAFGCPLTPSGFDRCQRNQNAEAARWLAARGIATPATATQSAQSPAAALLRDLLPPAAAKAALSTTP